MVPCSAHAASTRSKPFDLPSIHRFLTGILQFFVATGDIPFMWIRDSAVQLGVLVPRIPQRPALRLLVEGAVRTQVTRGHAVAV